MLLTTARALACLTLLSLAAAPELAFRPAEGGRWRKTFTVIEELALDRFRVTFGGEDVPSEFLPAMEMSTRSVATTVLVDRYGAVESGRPLALARTFETIDVAHRSEFHLEAPGADGEDYDSDVEGASPLAGRTVEFRWDEDAGAHEPRVDGDAIGADVLATLVEETDLRSWLPPEGAEEGARWTLPSEAIEQVLRPGGALGIELEGAGAEHWADDWRAHRTEGEIELVLASIDRGAERARIAIAGEVREIGEQEGDLSRVPVVQGEATQTDTTTYRLRGELTWSLARGLPEALALEADVRHESVTRKDGGEPEYEHVLELLGRLSVAMTCEPAE